MPPHLFHIAEPDDWDRARANRRYRTRSLETEGFIHCSSARQLPAVAARYYRGRSDLLLLEIDEAKLRSPVVRENTTGGTELFPHIYGELGIEAVLDVTTFAVSHSGDVSHDPVDQLDRGEINPKGIE